MSDILKKYRASSAKLASLSDDDLIKAIHAASGVGGNPYSYARDYLGVQEKGSFARDTAIDLGKGVLGAAQIATGAMDLLTGGAVDSGSRFLEEKKRSLGEDTYSTKRKESDYNLSAAEGFWNTLGAAVKNPRSTVGMAIEATPSMAIPMGVGGLAAKGAVKGAQAVGPQLPKALADTAMKASNIGQTLGWAGVTAGQTASRVMADDPNNVGGMYGAALGAGALVGGLTHGASILPGGNIAKQAISAPRRVLESTANQAGQLVGQGVAQTGAENLAMGRPVGQGMAEAVAIGLVNAPVFGVLGARRRPDFEGSPAAQEAEGSRAPFTTEEIAHAWSERRRANAISNYDTMYATPQGEVLNEQQLPAYEQFGREMQQQGQRPVDTSAAQLAATQEQGKAVAPKEPPPQQVDVESVFTKYGEPQRVPRTYADGKVVMGPDGQPSMTTHFDGSHIPKAEGAPPIPYDSPERLKKAIEKLAKEEAAKPPHQRAAEQVYSDAVLSAMDRRPTSAEVRRVSNLLDLKDLDSVEAIDVRLQAELAKLEKSKKPDPFVKDTLTEFHKFVQAEIAKNKKEEATTRPAAEVPKAEMGEPVKAEPIQPDTTLAAAKPEQQLDVMALLNKLAEQAPRSGTEAIQLKDANGKVRTMTRAQYIQNIAAFKGKDLARLQRLLGMDDERRIVNQPMTFAEMAAAEGVSPSAIAKWATKHGLTEDVVNKVVQDDVVPVGREQESEFVSNAAEGEEASGFSIRNEGELNKGGFHGGEYTARDARADALANTLMAHEGNLPNTINTGVKPHHAPAQARQEELRVHLKERKQVAEKVTEEQRLKAQQENFARMVKEAETSKFKESAERMYYAMRERGTQGYDSLTPEQKVRWVAMVDAHMNAKRMGDRGLPDADFIQLIKEYDERNQRELGDRAGSDAEGRSGDAQAVHTDGSEDGAQAAGAARSTPTVVVKKRRTAVKPEAQQSGARAVTETPEFKKWFGDSKVVDANGDPKVMYHGTTGDFSAFKTDNETIFLTEDPSFASKFALVVGYKKGGGESPNIMPVYVRAEHPFDPDNPASLKEFLDNVFYEGNPHLSGRPGNWRVAGFLTRPMLEIQLANGLSNWSTLESKWAQDAIQDAGFDSFYVREEGRKNLAVRTAEQIKSATGNNGKFDPNNPDVTQSATRQTNGYTAESLKKEILDFMEVDGLPAHMRIVNSTDISPGEAKSVGMHEFTQAWVDRDGNMVLLADRVQAGTGRAVFLHEVGSHLGIDQIFTEAQRSGIVRQIARMEERGSALEKQIAAAAFARMERYDGNKDASIRDSETIAYFVEEAVQRMHADGIDVRIRGKGKTPLQQLLHKIEMAFKAAFAKLFGKDPRNMSLDDIVDMAYGAAKLNLTEGQRIPFRGLSDQQSALVSKRTMEENIKRLPPRLQKPVRGITATLRDVTSRAGMAAAFLPDLADWAAKHNMPSMKKVAEFTARKGAYRLELDQKLGEVVKKLQDLKPADKSAAQKFLHDSTMEQKWGYKPSWRDDVTVDADAEKKWKALSPEARAVADEMLRHGEEMWQAKRQAINDMALAMKQEMIADAEAAGKPQEEIEAMWGEVDKLTRDVPAKLEGPYVPLKRFGNFVVTMKSPELLKAELDDLKKYREMLSDPAHYRVEFVDSTYAAVNRKAELEGANPSMKVEYSAKEKHDYLGAGYETLERLANAVRTRMKEASEEDRKLSEATHRALHEAIVQSMGEYNARTSTLQRKYVAGMNPDEIGRAFATSGYSDNRFLASVLHNKEINDAMSQLRREAMDGGDRRVKQDFFNEMQMRRAAMLQPEPARWIGHAMRFTTLWKLVSSPAYYLQYITQPITMFLPVVQGRHGYASSFGAMSDAVKDMISISKGLFDTDISKIKDANERKMLEDLKKTGTIQIGHDQSFGRLETLPDNGVSKVWARVTDTVNKVPLSVEMHNRVASALAAYRLERKKGSTHEQAVDYTRSVINQSYGDYTSYSAPRIMQGSGLRKLVMQYRQFQFIHMALLTRLLHNAFGGADAETKRAARMQLTYMAGHYGVLAGAVGVPAANILAAVVRAVFGDDEDKDTETFVKRHVDNKFVQDMILGGVPRAVFGQDLSSRLGAGDIASPARYVDMGDALKDKSGYNNALVGLLGPFAASMVPQVLQGAGMIYNGDYYRGMENLMPKGVSDVMKAIRFSNEGVTNKHGTVTTPAEDLGVGDVLGKALGSNPTNITGPAHDAYVVSSIESEFRDEARNLKRKFVEARKDGDSTADIVAKWKKLMERQRKAGVKPSTLSDLYKAPSQMRKREKEVLNGVPYNKRNRKLVESITAEE